MGTWDAGPFDNDSAADWCGALDAAAPDDRPALLRATLTRTADHGPDDYLDSDDACPAIAAAAVVASQLPGGPAITSSYAPDFIVGGGTVPIAPDLPALALRALDRVFAPNSEWPALWKDADGTVPPALLAILEPYRTPLERAAAA
jgi:hypothetical protein